MRDKTNKECAVGCCTQATTDLRMFDIKRRRKRKKRPVCYTCYLALVLRGVEVAPWEDAERYFKRT